MAKYSWNKVVQSCFLSSNFAQILGYLLTQHKYSHLYGSYLRERAMTFIAMQKSCTITRAILFS